MFGSTFLKGGKVRLKIKTLVFYFFFLECNRMPKLLGVIKFLYDETKTRSLNATQAYDGQSSGIVLGSFAASAEIKSSLNKNKDSSLGSPIYAVTTSGITALSLNGNGASDVFDLLGQQAVLGKGLFSPNVVGANVTYTEISGEIAKDGRNVNYKNVFQFSATGTLTLQLTLQPDVAAEVPQNSTASNITTFYGGIPVAIGRYKSWQGKYAVLTVNKVNKKAKLRIFDE